MSFFLKKIFKKNSLMTTRLHFPICPAFVILIFVSFFFVVFHIYPLPFIHTRTIFVGTFRKQHEQLRTVIVRVLKATSATNNSEGLMNAEDAGAIQEVNLAYEDAKQVDVLDLSDSGTKTWEAAKRR